LASAVIVEPTGESDSPLKFTAGLLLGITLDAEISNVADTSLIRIQVRTQFSFVRLFSTFLYCTSEEVFSVDEHFQDSLIHFVDKVS
jgi:hypothetical protein